MRTIFSESPPMATKFESRDSFVAALLLPRERTDDQIDAISISVDVESVLAAASGPGDRRASRKERGKDVGRRRKEKGGGRRKREQRVRNEDSTQQQQQKQTHQVHLTPVQPYTDFVDDSALLPAASDLTFHSAGVAVLESVEIDLVPYTLVTSFDNLLSFL